jgi:hypothetical protein
LPDCCEILKAGMMRGNPDPSPETRFQPGQSGNPGGLTKELRAQIDANAAQAVRIRAAILAKMAALVDPESGLFMGDLGGDVLKLIKDSEDRGLGAPQQTVDVNQKQVAAEPMTAEQWAAKHGGD